MRGPTPLARVLLAACAAGSTLGASLWVSSRTGPAVVAIPTLSGPSYARDVGGFHHVTPSLVTDLTPTPAPRPAPEPTPVRASPTTVPDVHAPSPSEPSPEPTVTTPPPAVLTVSMSSDVARAHPNQTITYTIRISNTSAVTADHVIVETHIPDGTSLQGWKCDGTTFTSSTDHFTCGSIGSAHPDHPIVFAIPALSSHTSIVETFWVQVDHNVGHNTAIVDHAHAFADNADVVDSSLVSVVVK